MLKKAKKKKTAINSTVFHASLRREAHHGDVIESVRSRLFPDYNERSSFNYVCGLLRLMTLKTKGVLTGWRPRSMGNPKVSILE